MLGKLRIGCEENPIGVRCGTNMLSGGLSSLGSRSGRWLHWTPERSICLVLIAGAFFLPLIALTDASLEADIASWRTPVLDTVMQGVTRLGYGGIDIGLLLGLALLGSWSGNRGLRNRGLAGSVTVAAAGLLDQIVKNILCRARPSAMGAGTFFVNFPCFPAPYADASFPSGHATTAFAASVLLGLWYPRWAGVFVGLAVLVGLSRVLLGAHFPSDVLAGALLGSGVALAVYVYVPAIRRSKNAGDVHG
jgi:membrane-associated phospholipid phosphatase